MILGVPAIATVTVTAGGGDDYTIVGHDRVFWGGAGLSQVLGPVRIEGGADRHRSGRRFRAAGWQHVRGQQRHRDVWRRKNG